MMTKEQKHTLKKVDAVLENIKKVIPEDFTPNQVQSVFQLYLSLYE